MRRWMIAIGVMMTLVALLHLSLFDLRFHLVSAQSAGYIATVLITGLTVVAAFFLAPHHRWTIALVVWIAFMELAPTYLRYSLRGTATGGSIGLILIVAWLRSARYPWAIQGAKVGIGLASLFVTALLLERVSERPLPPENWPPELRRAQETNPSSPIAFYSHDLFGILDIERVWRIDATTETINALVHDLKLQATNTAPQSFWTQPPHYWPRSMPRKGQAFQSELFSANNMPDGTTYFLVHDPVRNQAFVWVKSRF